MLSRLILCSDQFDRRVTRGQHKNMVAATGIDRIAGAIRATHADFQYQAIGAPEELGNGGRVKSGIWTSW